MERSAPSKMKWETNCTDTRNEGIKQVFSAKEDQKSLGSKASFKKPLEGSDLNRHRQRGFLLTPSYK